MLKIVPLLTTYGGKESKTASAGGKRSVSAMNMWTEADDISLLEGVEA